MGRIRNIFRSLYNLFYYFKTIWNDRDWDHMYIEELHLKKFKKAYKFRTTSKYCMRCEGQEKYDQALRICINILERRQKDWYTEVWYEWEGKYIDYEWIDVPGSKLVELKSHKNPKNLAGYVEDYRDKTQSVEERDWKNYCEIIKKYQRHWWD